MPDWYTVSGEPSTSSSLSSATMRTEFTAIETAMEKLPVLAGNGSKPVAINAGGTLIEAVTAASFRTILGLGTADSPTFTGTTLTGGLTAGAASVISVNSASDALRVTQIGAGNALVVEDSTNPDATPFVITADGYIVHGHTARLASGSGLTEVEQTHGTAAGSSSKSQNTWSAASAGTAPVHTFNRSRGGINTHTIVQDGDYIGQILFAGSDGVEFAPAVSIRGEVDGTPGTGDMPGRLVFSTSPDGTAGPVERLRINPDGRVYATGGVYISKTAVTSPVTADGNVHSGTYTSAQVDTNTNVAAVTFYDGTYMRVGNTVTVSLNVDIDPTAATTTVLKFSLPVASNFASFRECVGVGVGGSSQVGYISGDTTNDCATYTFTATSTANLAHYLHFTYEVI